MQRNAFPLPGNALPRKGRRPLRPQRRRMSSRAAACPQRAPDILKGRPIVYRAPPQKGAIGNPNSGGGPGVALPQCIASQGRRPLRLDPSSQCVAPDPPQRCARFKNRPFRRLAAALGGRLVAMHCLSRAPPFEAQAQCIASQKGAALGARGRQPWQCIASPKGAALETANASRWNATHSRGAARR